MSLAHVPWLGAVATVTGAGDAADEDVQWIMATLGRARSDVAVVDMRAALRAAQIEAILDGPVAWAAFVHFGR